MAHPKKPNRHLPVGSDDERKRWVRFPTVPELSPKRMCKAVDDTMIAVAYEIDFAKKLRQAWESNPLRMIELYLNRYPNPELKSMGVGQELHIQVVNAPQMLQPVPGVISSPIEGHVGPNLKLVVNATPVETIEEVEPEEGS